jgi:hypothetical protein
MSSPIQPIWTLLCLFLAFPDFKGHVRKNEKNFFCYLNLKLYFSQVKTSHQKKNKYLLSIYKSKKKGLVFIFMETISRLSSHFRRPQSLGCSSLRPLWVF